MKELIFWLTEIVSKGGNYMLNIGPKASGEVPIESVNNLLEVGKWLKINGEAIYNTRKWNVTHEGPTIINMDGTGAREKEGFKVAFTPQDFWFTQKGSDIFAIAIEYPEDKVLIKSLGKETVGKIKAVKMLGSQSEIEWKQTNEGLSVDIGKVQINSNGYALKIGI